MLKEWALWHLHSTASAQYSHKPHHTYESENSKHPSKAGKATQDAGDERR